MPVCVGPGRKPYCWFSQEAAQIINFTEAQQIVVDTLISLLDGEHINQAAHRKESLVTRSTSRLELLEDKYASAKYEVYQCQKCIS